jgi:nitroreductase
VSAIQFTDRGVAVRVSGESGVLARAALTAGRAPSILNSQPWRWRVGGRVLELWADRSRQVAALDPDARMLTLSCGVALHHARVALAAEGVRTRVEYLPDPADPDLLATVTHLGIDGTPDPASLRAYRAIATRHSDRRPFANEPVPDGALDQLRAVAERAGAHLHLVPGRDVAWLTLAAERAAGVALTEPDIRAAIADWMRPAGGPDGVPVDTIGPTAPRPVPMRPFMTNPQPQDTTAPSRPTFAWPRPEPGDTRTRYAIIFTARDGRHDWLAAGEALSAVLLTAAAEGLATSVMSDAVEVPEARALLRRALPTAAGRPAVVVRIGRPAAGPEARPAERRPGREVIQLAAEPVESTPARPDGSGNVVPGDRAGHRP